MNIKKYTSSQQVFIKVYIKNYSNVLVITYQFAKIPNILNEEDIHIVPDEIVNNKDFEKSDIEIETYDSFEELKYPQEYNFDQSINLSDDLNQKEKEDSRFQAMFKRSTHNNMSIFVFSQDYYELSKRTIRCNGNIYHIFKTNNYRDVHNLYQDKASTDIILNEFKNLTSTCWNEKCIPLTIGMTRDKYTG